MSAIQYTQNQEFISEDGLNANSTSTVSSSITGIGKKYASFYVSDAGGAHNTHVLTVQVSPDGTQWFNTSTTLTGVGLIPPVLICCHSVRLKITTAQGASSTINIQSVTI